MKIFNFLYGLLLFVTALFFVCGKYGGEVQAAQQLWHKFGSGIKIGIIPLAGDTSQAKLNLVFLDKNRYYSKILYAQNFGKKMLPVREMALQTGAVAAINGGYFDEDDNPLGFLKVSGKLKNDYIAEQIIYSGVVQLNSGQVSIVHRDGFKQAKVYEAFQVGPRLIANGNSTQGLSNTIDYRKRARRSGLALDKEGNVILFSTSNCTANWQQIIRTLLQAKALRIQCAINLDGGSSTQLYVRSGQLSLDEGYLHVPVALGFYQKDGGNK